MLVRFGACEKKKRPVREDRSLKVGWTSWRGERRTWFPA
jgi:hypothetical protein